MAKKWKPENKSKKINGQIYKFVAYFKTKLTANKIAKEMRKQGWKVRVIYENVMGYKDFKNVKYTKDYVVYFRKK